MQVRAGGPAGVANGADHIALAHALTANHIETDNGSTQIDISTQVTRINFFQVNQRLLENNLKKQLQENLSILKDLLEENTSVSGHQEDSIRK